MSITTDVLAKIVFQREYSSVGLSGVIYGLMGALHVIKTEKGLRVDLQSALALLATSCFYGVMIEKAGIMQIDHMSHLSGYVAGLAFGWLSNKM